mmetsp:Transcript_54240/g.176218  ORF Transcript_54240/g.176218 Transcript_54240/m.176218 type:complete len:377 (-) Transcript_54240:168-1298(-)
MRLDLHADGHALLCGCAVGFDQLRKLELLCIVAVLLIVALASCQDVVHVIDVHHLKGVCLPKRGEAREVFQCTCVVLDEVDALSRSGTAPILESQGVDPEGEVRLRRPSSRRDGHSDDGVALLQVDVHLGAVVGPAQVLRLQVHCGRVAGASLCEVELVGNAAVFIPIHHGLQRQRQVHALGDQLLVCAEAAAELHMHDLGCVRVELSDQGHRALRIDQLAVDDRALGLASRGEHGAVVVRGDHVREGPSLDLPQESRSLHRCAPLRSGVDPDAAVADGVFGTMAHEQQLFSGANVDIGKLEAFEVDCQGFLHCGLGAVRPIHDVDIALLGDGIRILLQVVVRRLLRGSHPKCITIAVPIGHEDARLHLEVHRPRR